jgi:urease accessory protein
LPTSLAIQQDIFAANRATGHIALSVAASAGRTRRTRVHEDGSLRVRFPNASAQALEAVIVNTGGGMTGGDRFAIEIALGAGASLIAGTAAAEKIYRSTGPDAEMKVRLDVGEGARLAWLPQETILFDRARLARRIDVELATSAALLMAEAVVFGRSAMGEAVSQGLFADRWRVRRGGRLVFAESARLDGAIAAKLNEPARAGLRLPPCWWRRPTTAGLPPCERSPTNLPARSASRSGAASRWRGCAPRTAQRCATI